VFAKFEPSEVHFAMTTSQKIQMFQEYGYLKIKKEKKKKMLVKSGKSFPSISSHLGF